MNHQEETRQNQLTEERASDRMTELKTKKAESAGAGALKSVFKNPLIKFLIPLLTKGGSGGTLPANIGYVIQTYIEEKKSGKSTNPAEYFVIGSLAATADAIGALGLTGILLPISIIFSLPCLIPLFIWRVNKHGLKSVMPTKKA